MAEKLIQLPQAARRACCRAETCKVPAAKSLCRSHPSTPMAGKAGEPHIPLALQSSRLRAEEKTLDFEFEVLSVQFNQRGCYALRLTVENPLLEGSGAGIQLHVDRGEVVQSCTSITDTIEQKDLNHIYSFQKRKFTFTLPRGKGLEGTPQGWVDEEGDPGAWLCKESGLS